jgi:hypothetical protein
MKWIIALLVIFLYVHLFNVISSLYFDSDRTITLFDIWELVKRNLRI